MTTWTVAYQALLSMRRFSRQEHRSGLTCPPPGDLPNPGTEPRSPALQADSLLSEPPGRHYVTHKKQALEPYGRESEQTPGDGEGQGSLARCSPWGCKELDTTKRLNNGSKCSYTPDLISPISHFLSECSTFTVNNEAMLIHHY